MHSFSLRRMFCGDFIVTLNHIGGLWREVRSVSPKSREFLSLQWPVAEHVVFGITDNGVYKHRLPAPLVDVLSSACGEEQPTQTISHIEDLQPGAARWCCGN